MPIAEEHLYEQGSKCCHQYSDLTMKIRTLAQYVMIAYTVGTGLIVTRFDVTNTKPFSLILAISGLIVVMFGIVLGVLNRHYSSAFEAIRNKSLVPIEARCEPKTIGPWTAHKELRSSQWWKTLAWDLAFCVLAITGLLGLLAGIGGLVAA